MRNVTVSAIVPTPGICNIHIGIASMRHRKTPEVGDLGREAVIRPGSGAVFTAVGIIDGKAVGSAAGDDDEMTGAREVARTKGKDEHRAVIQRVFHRLFPERQLLRREAEAGAALAYESPRAAVSGHAVAVLLGHARDVKRRERGVFCQIHRRHRQAGRTAAGGADKARAVGLVAPALIPLYEKRHAAAVRLGGEVDVEALAMLFGIGVDKVYRLRAWRRRSPAPCTEVLSPGPAPSFPARRKGAHCC